MPIITIPDWAASSVADLRAMITPSIAALIDFEVQRGVHRMTIMRELYRYAAFHAKSVTIKDGQIIDIIFDNDTEQLVGEFKRPHLTNPFFPMAHSLHGSLWPRIQTDHGRYEFESHHFVDALYYLAFLEKSVLKEFFSSPILTERVLKLLMKRGSKACVAGRKMHGIPCLNMKDGTYLLPLPDASFLPVLNTIVIDVDPDDPENFSELWKQANELDRCLKYPATAPASFTSIT